MTLHAYQTLYESSIAFGIRKALQAEQGKTDMENYIAKLEEEKAALEKEVSCVLQVDTGHKSKLEGIRLEDHLSDGREKSSRAKASRREKTWRRDKLPEENKSTAEGPARGNHITEEIRKIVILTCLYKIMISRNCLLLSIK